MLAATPASVTTNGLRMPGFASLPGSSLSAPAPNSVVVGNVTTNTVSGLTSGVTYFFAITAYNVAGMESPFSNEIIFVPGLPTVRIGALSSGAAVLTVKGLIGHTYDIQATPDLKNWTVIGTATVGPSGSVNFTNSNAGSFARRFYRTRDTQP